MGLHQLSDDALGPITAYGKDLLQLGESYELLIVNGLSYFLESCYFTCFPYSKGASVVNYVMSSQTILPFIRPSH